MADKPPLLFIHGMWSRPDVWEPMRLHFEAAGYQVSTPALPGHAAMPEDAPAPELATYGLADYAAAVDRAAGELDGPPVLIGHSMGGLLVQLAALRRRPRALVLLSPAPSAGILSLEPAPVRTLWPVISRWGFWRETTRLPAEACRYGIFNGVDPVETEEQIAAMLPDSGRALFQIALPLLDSSGGASVAYGQLNMPALVMVGTEDRITPPAVARATARKLTGTVTYREMDGFGHWIIGTAGWGQVADAIEAFIATLP